MAKQSKWLIINHGKRKGLLGYDLNTTDYGISEILFRNGEIAKISDRSYTRICDAAIVGTGGAFDKIIRRMDVVEYDGVPAFTK